MAKRGRPVRSEIRQNIVEILYFLGKGHGYQIYKIYKAVFPKCTNEVIYYHLKKGVLLGEFKVAKIKQEKGNYSWGPTAEKIYYSLGREASPKIDKKVKKYIDKMKIKSEH